MKICKIGRRRRKMKKEPKPNYDRIERSLADDVKYKHYAYKQHLIKILTLQSVNDEGAICYAGDLDRMIKEEQEKEKELNEAIKRLKEFREQTEHGKIDVEFIN